MLITLIVSISKSVNMCEKLAFKGWDAIGLSTYSSLYVYALYCC